MKFECILGIADNANVNVIVMQGDIVEFISAEEREVAVFGVAGWCKNKELCFNPRQFTEHFKVIGLSYTL